MTFEELGAALCAERERRGLSLDDVAAHLKISTRLIQALESGDLSALPHPAYTKGFLRAYASYMALDPEAVAEVAHALQPAAATECTVMGGDEDLRSNPAILRHGARQGIAGWLRVFILLILVVALAGGGWMLWQRGVFKDLTGSKEQSLPPWLLPLSRWLRHRLPRRLRRLLRPEPRLPRLPRAMAVRQLLPVVWRLCPVPHSLNAVPRPRTRA